EVIGVFAFRLFEGGQGGPDLFHVFEVGRLGVLGGVAGRRWQREKREEKDEEEGVFHGAMRSSASPGFVRSQSTGLTSPVGSRVSRRTRTLGACSHVKRPASSVVPMTMGVRMGVPQKAGKPLKSTVATA